MSDGEFEAVYQMYMARTRTDLTLAIYARQMNRRDAEPERLEALVQALIGQQRRFQRFRAHPHKAQPRPKTRLIPAVSLDTPG